MRRDYPRAVAEFLADVGRVRGERWELRDCPDRSKSMCFLDSRRVRCPAPRSAMDALLCLHEVGHAATYDRARKDVEHSHVLPGGARDLRTEAEAWLWAVEAWRRLGGVLGWNASAYVAAMLGTYVRGNWLAREVSKLYRAEERAGAVYIVAVAGEPRSDAETARRVAEHVRMVRLGPVTEALAARLHPGVAPLVRDYADPGALPGDWALLRSLWARFGIREPRPPPKEMPPFRIGPPVPTSPWPWP